MSKSGYTKAWLESSCSNLATTNRPGVHNECEEGFATRLYSLCRSVFGDLCSQEQDFPSRRLQLLLLREELAKLYLWGQAFGPGELDKAIDYSEDVRYLVFDALGEVGRTVLRGKVSGNRLDARLDTCYVYKQY